MTAAQVLGWVALAVVALVYVGGIAQWWSEWRTYRNERRRFAAAALLAVVWPWAIGAALVRWIREMS